MGSVRGLLPGRLWLTLGLLTVAPIGGAARRAEPLPALAHRHRPLVIRERYAQGVKSTNWSGYAVAASAGSVTDAKGSWVVPTIQKPCPRTNQYASFWVGIDGFDSNTVEQIGTDSDCQNGVPTYYAWFELYPHPGFLINGLTIHPGDVISAEVSYNSANGQFTVSMTDLTSKTSFSTSTRESVRVKRSSAEWIAEAPSSDSGAILPLADFGTIYYGLDHTEVSNTNDATVAGKIGAIGAFGSEVQMITMVTESGATKAEPSLLSTDGMSFSDEWVSAGP